MHIYKVINIKVNLKLDSQKKKKKMFKKKKKVISASSIKKKKKKKKRQYLHIHVQWLRLTNKDISLNNFYFVIFKLKTCLQM